MTFLRPRNLSQKLPADFLSGVADQNWVIGLTLKQSLPKEWKLSIRLSKGLLLGLPSLTTEGFLNQTVVNKEEGGQ